MSNTIVCYYVNVYVVTISWCLIVIHIRVGHTCMCSHVSFVCMVIHTCTCTNVYYGYTYVYIYQSQGKAENASTVTTSSTVLQ